MWLNKRGPVPVSDKDLKAYQNLFPVKPTFRMLYNTWIDEHYDDALRRLCLRDMIWQNCGACYYDTDGQKLTDIFFVASQKKDRDDGKARLAETLKMRPKLLNELVEEFLWTPSKEEQDEYHISPRKGACEDEMIEFLLPLVDRLRGEKLWQRHSESQGDQHRFSRLNIWERMAGQPAWLDSLLKDDLREGLLREITSNIDALREHHRLIDLPDDSLDQLQLFLQVTQIADNYQYTTQHKDLTHFIELICMLNVMLPEGFRYLTFGTLTHVLPYLQTKEYIIKTARRHLMGEDEPTGMWHAPKVEVLNFFYWLYGIVSIYASTDTEFIKQIKRLISIARDNPQKFAKDSRKAVVSATQFLD